MHACSVDNVEHEQEHEHEYEHEHEVAVAAGKVNMRNEW